MRGCWRLCSSERLLEVVLFNYNNSSLLLHDIKRGSTYRLVHTPL